MRKLYVLSLAMMCILQAFAQPEPSPKKKKYNLTDRAADHLMIQFSKDSWLGAADSVKDRIKTFSKGFNAALMFDFPFKSQPRLSVGLGLGVSTSGMMFKETFVDVAAQTPTIPVINADTISHFKKFKLATSYAEVPLELRFTANPETPGKTFKIAVGIKVGTLLNAHSKGKNLQNGQDETINSFTQKISSKSYFNSTRVATTARIGYGYFTLFGSYNLTTIFKDDVAPDTKLLQVGITFSGL